MLDVVGGPKDENNKTMHFPSFVFESIPGRLPAAVAGC